MDNNSKKKGHVIQYMTIHHLNLRMLQESKSSVPQTKSHQMRHSFLILSKDFQAHTGQKKSVK